MPFIDRLSRLLPKGAFARSLALIAGGTAAGQAITMLAAPALSRLYGPHEFGVLAVYTSIAGALGTISALAYQLAIPVPEDDRQAANISAVAGSCVLLTSALTALAAFLVWQRIDAWTGVQGFAGYLWCIPLGVLGAGAYEVASQWATRKKEFGVIARTSAERGFGQVALQLVGGFLAWGPIGLVVGQLFGQWGGTLRIFRLAYKKDKAALKAVGFADMKEAARKYREFPLLSGPSALLNALDVNSAPILFSYFFGAGVTGLYALGYRVLSVPFWLVGSSAQKVFFASAAEAARRGTLAEETLRTLEFLVRIVFPMIAVLTVAAPEVFAVIFGAEWREAGVYMQWLSTRTCLTLIVFPLTPLVYVLSKQRAMFVFNVVQFISRVGAVVVGAAFGSAWLAVALLGTGTALVWVGFLAYLLAISGNSMGAALRLAGRQSLHAAVFAAPTLLAKVLGLPDVLVVAVAGIAFAAAMGKVLWARKSSATSVA